MMKRANLLQKKQQILNKIEALHMVPENARQKFEQHDAKKLLKTLKSVNLKLQNYRHVNKKAVDEHTRFTGELDRLMREKEKHDEATQAIMDLIQQQDLKKEEAITRTFKQIAKYFEEVFATLVPAGSGHLILQRKDVPAVDEHGGFQDAFTGVSFRVRQACQCSSLHLLRSHSTASKTRGYGCISYLAVKRPLWH